MSNSETYKTGLSIALAHTYYTQSACPATLIPDAVTNLIIHRYNMLFKEQSPNKWTLLVKYDFRKEDLSDEEVRFCFILRVQDKLFYYVSLEIEAAKEFSVQDSDMPNVWKKIGVDLKSITGTDVHIRITGIEKYLEYICIPKYSLPPSISMREEKSRIRFTEAEPVSIPDLRIAFRFVTEEKIKLTQNIEIRAQLWEIRTNGNRLIASCLPNPRPNQPSPIAPKEMITTFFYF